jgi:hypothetical protein
MGASTFFHRFTCCLQQVVEEDVLDELATGLTTTVRARFVVDEGDSQHSRVRSRHVQSQVSGLDFSASLPPTRAFTSCGKGVGASSSSPHMCCCTQARLIFRLPIFTLNHVRMEGNNHTE